VTALYVFMLLLGYGMYHNIF